MADGRASMSTVFGLSSISSKGYMHANTSDSVDKFGFRLGYLRDDQWKFSAEQLGQKSIHT
jgi:hypothetical protein